MAKRRTLRRQLDQARKELDMYKRKAIYRCFMSQWYKPVCLKAYHEYLDPDPDMARDPLKDKEIIRLQLHEFVDEGLFDKAVITNSVSFGSARRMIMEINLLSL